MYDGRTAFNIAIWDGSTFSALTLPPSYYGLNSAVTAMVANDDLLYIGGGFSAYATTGTVSLDADKIVSYNPFGKTM
jgi:hypothetical protein